MKSLKLLPTKRRSAAALYCPAILSLITLALTIPAITFLAAIPPANAEEAAKKSIAIELNAQQQVGTACQLNFIIKNTLGTAIDDLTFEIVLFDTNAQISSIMTARSGTLPDGKTRVKRYALKDKNCKEISQILINDVKACKGEALSPEICLAALTTSSRTDSKLEL